MTILLVMGIYNDGGNAEYVLVPSYKDLVKIGEDMDIDPVHLDVLVLHRMVQ
jgi:threonine dehydrogenase-like Zn-dependent dehydrogenase